MHQNHRPDGERCADCPAAGAAGGAAWVHILPWEMMFVLFAVLAAIAFVGLQRAMPETATRMGEKLSMKELGRDYGLVLKNLRFVAGALATGFVSLPRWRGLPSRR